MDNRIRSRKWFVKIRKNQFADRFAKEINMLLTDPVLKDHQEEFAESQ